MTDLVELKVKGDPRSVKANRDDLIRESLYFKAMFSENFVEQGKKTIELGLEGVISFEILEIIVQSMGAVSRTTPTKDTIEKLILAADFFQMNAFKSYLGAQIYTFGICVDSSNAIRLWQLTTSLNSVDIRNSLEFYIKEKFEYVAFDISFVRLDVESVRTILEWDRLNVTSEKQVLAVIKMWINFAYQERIQHFTRLLHCVRFDWKISFGPFLKDIILNYCACVACTDFVYQYEVLQKNRELVVGINMRSRFETFDAVFDSLEDDHDIEMSDDDFEDDYFEDDDECFMEGGPEFRAEFRAYMFELNGGRRRSYRDY